MRAFFLVLAFAAVAGGLIWAESRGWLTPPERDAESLRLLTRPIRLSVTSETSVQELLQALRINHYRLGSLAEADFRDWFYDTADGALAERGWSFRFRQRRSGTSGSAWSIRLEREPRFLDEGEAKTDIRSDVAEDLARRIVGGAWGQAVVGTEGLEASDRLRTLLAGLGIEPADVAPRFVGDLHRVRSELTDKGRSWFEMDRETWTFRAMDGGEETRFLDVVLDTLLKKRDPELTRRVRTMTMLVTEMLPVARVETSPLERARDALAGR
jgi:hypothetical protein